MTTQEKVLNACYRLNAEAYEFQVIAAGKKLKQFIPCPKAEALMAHIRKDRHFGTCHMEAAHTICSCHTGLSESGLTAYEYDDTYKLANYNHDLKVLYPKFYH